MTITKDQVETLGRLYREREEIQKVRDIATRNFWIGVANEMFSGTGTRSAVVGGLGGTADFASLMANACAEEFEDLQKRIDAAIVENGGQP